MKPRTKLQRRIVAASGRLPEITPAQLHWGYAHLLPHEAFRTKRGKITCTECRHTWQGDQQIDRAVCPHCGVRLTVVTTRRRTSWNKAYLSVVTTRKGLQVVRYFLLERQVRDGQPARYECCEVMQRWITPDGKIATVARMRNMSYYSYDVWRCATPLELRSECWFYNRISVERSYPRCRLIPELRRMGLRYDLYAENPVGIFRYTFSQRHAETLLKIRRYDLFRYFCRAGGRRIEDYWPSLRICLRNGYRIDDAASWCDYIDMLSRLGKDIHNAHYVCPSDFRQAHDRCHALLARIEAEEEAARRRAEYLEYEKQYRKAKGKYLGIAFSDGEIEVRVLQSVQEFIEEGKAMHHCVERYHDKSDSLILSARIADRRVETVEVSLSRLQVVQSRGACNRNTEYHDRIVRLVNDNMSLVRAARHKRDKAPRIATLGRAASDRLKVSA